MLDFLSTYTFKRSGQYPRRGAVDTSALTLAAVLLLAAALRIYGLFEWPLEQDELYTVRDSLGFNIAVHYKRPLYFLLQHVILQTLPPSVPVLRTMPFMFGVAGVLATWYLAKHAFGTTAALVSALLVAVAPWHIYASQFARYWTLVYLLAALTYLLLLKGLDDDRPRTHLLTLLILLLGAFTHPTFAFPVAGVVIGLLLVSKDGQFKLSWPTRRAWTYLWGPVLALGTVGIVVLAAAGEGALSFRTTRDLTSVARVVPSIVEWLSPVLVIAAVLGAIHQALSRRTTDRRWSVMTVLGCVVGLGLLLAMSALNDVYNIYFTAALPLVFVTIGGLVQRLEKSSTIRSPAVAVGCAAVLIAAMLPGTVSHLSDGTRFDYRPVFEYIRKSGDEQRPVVGWPAVVHRHYAADLPYKRLRLDPEFLQATLEAEGNFWLILRKRRYGIVGSPSYQVLRWIGGNCKEVREFFRPRIDYREYRLQLYSCGKATPAPEPDALGRPAE